MNRMVFIFADCRCLRRFMPMVKRNPETKLKIYNAATAAIYFKQLAQSHVFVHSPARKYHGSGMHGYDEKMTKKSRAVTKSVIALFSWQSRQRN